MTNTYMCLTKFSNLFITITNIVPQIKLVYLNILAQDLTTVAPAFVDTSCNDFVNGNKCCGLGCTNILIPFKSK